MCVISFFSFSLLSFVRNDCRERSCSLSSASMAGPSLAQSSLAVALAPVGGAQLSAAVSAAALMTRSRLQREGEGTEPFPLLSSSLGLELKSRRSEATAAAGSPRLARRSAERESKSVITHHLWLLKSDWIDDFCGIRDHRSRFTLRRLLLSPSDSVRWNHKMKRAKLSSLQRRLQSP